MNYAWTKENNVDDATERAERSVGDFRVARLAPSDRGRHISYWHPDKPPVYGINAFVEAPAGQDPDAYADKYIEAYLVPATRPFIIES